jgi:hypothetical protein
LSRRTQAKLVGAIRLVPEVDAIGIPVFGANNAMFVPEMDTDFRITRFLDFFNSEGYQIDYALPGEFQSRVFSIGAPAPLPFWFHSSGHIIEGDAEQEDLARRFGSQAADNPVLADLGNILNDARSGVFRRRKEKWTANEIAACFSDVFYESPVHSKYWVRRYSVAVANARSLTQPPHPIDLKLRRVALDWLKRFASKTDFTRLVSLLGNPENGIITERRYRDILFAFIVNKLATGGFPELEKYADHPVIERYFPSGIGAHFEAQDWPRVPFEYRRPAKLVDILIEEIAKARKTRHYNRAAKMTYLFYRRGHVPRAIDDITFPILNEEMDVFRHMRERADGIFETRDYADYWSEMASDLLRQYDRLMVIDGILNGDARLSTVIVDRRFGVNARYIKQIKRYVQPD